jgi:hypothetical protein
MRRVLPTTTETMVFVAWVQLHVALISNVLYLTAGGGTATRAGNIISANDDKELISGPDPKRNSWNLRTSI